MKKENLAILEMLACAALWSIAGILIKLIPWTGFSVAGFRGLIAGITIAIYMAIKKYKFILNKKTLITGLLSGLVYTCFVCSNKMTTAANAIVLQFTSPVFIVVFSALIFGKKIKHADVLVVLFTLIGITLTFLDELQGGYVMGNVVAIGAGMFMAGMYMAVGELGGEERFSGILLGQLFTFLIGLPSIIISKPEFTLPAVLCILALGVFQLGISYILYIKSSLYCPPLACCLLGAVEPLLNPVWVMIFDGETPGPLALTGGLIVIASVTVWCIFGKESAQAV